MQPQATAPPTPDAKTMLDRARQVFTLEADALTHAATTLDHQFVAAIDCLKATKGRIIITGMGKSGLVGRKMAATFSSTGSSAYFLHPAEGTHGDLGLLMADDVVIAISYSGETPEVLTILPLIRRLQLPLIALTRQPQSTLGQAATVVLSIEVLREACPMNLAPTASTTVTMAMGDALAVTLLAEKGFTEDDFARVHPAGALGRRLLYQVGDVMRTAPLPLVTPETSFMDTLLEISQQRLGLALIVDAEQRLLGILTDGDVRRALTRYPNPQAIALTEVMNPQPKLIPATVMATDALQLMQHCKVTALVIVNDQHQPVGVCHLHDLLQLGL
jgi:arabinose-5-phosphate isomerase